MKCYKAKGEYKEEPSIVKKSKDGKSLVITEALGRMSDYLGSVGNLVLDNFGWEDRGDKVYHVITPAAATTVVVSRMLGGAEFRGSYQDATFSDGTLWREHDSCTVIVSSGQEQHAKQVLEDIINSVGNDKFAEKVNRTYNSE